MVTRKSPPLSRAHAGAGLIYGHVTGLELGLHNQFHMYWSVMYCHLDCRNLWCNCLGWQHIFRDSIDKIVRDLRVL